MEFRSHLETRTFVVPPPPGEARHIRSTRVPLVHKASANASWTSIQVLVAAPDSEIWSAVMEFEWNVSDGVRQIKTDDTPFATRESRDLRQIERLSGRIVHAAKQD